MTCFEPTGRKVAVSDLITVTSNISRYERLWSPRNCTGAFSVELMPLIKIYPRPPLSLEKIYCLICFVYLYLYYANLGPKGAAVVPSSLSSCHPLLQLAGLIPHRLLKGASTAPNMALVLSALHCWEKPEHTHLTQPGCSIPSVSKWSTHESHQLHLPSVKQDMLEVIVAIYCDKVICGNPLAVNG